MNSSTKNLIIIAALFVVFKISNVSALEPITTIVAAAVGASGVGYYFKEYTYCRFYECCDDHNIPGHATLLYDRLQASLFGQHIVVQQVSAAVTAHVRSNNARKPLVMSFHGTPGTGKNFVADQIAEALYKNGVKSKYVHKYLGRADFPQAAFTDLYNERITRDVLEAVKDCPRSLFIFDEVDKMPPGVFYTLTSLVDFNAHHSGLDFSKAIFIFLSNTAGVHISNHLGKLITDGTLREDTKMKDFENLLQRAAYNLEGGLKQTSLIESHVIDHYVPFLPLEKSHVVKCIKAEYNRWLRIPQQDEIDEIASMITYEKQYGMFAVSGCKTLEKKVAVNVYS